MNYKDNILPPEETLNKMAMAFKNNERQKAHVLNLRNQKVKALINKKSEEALSKLLYSFKSFKHLKIMATTKIHKDNIEKVLNKTESNIEELKILYEHLEVECPRVSTYNNYCNSLKFSIDSEINSVKALFDLRKIEIDKDTKQIVDRVTDNRLEVLKQLNSMFGTCKYRK